MRFVEMRFTKECVRCYYFTAEIIVAKGITRLLLLVLRNECGSIEASGVFVSRQLPLSVQYATGKLHVSMYVVWCHGIDLP